MDNSIIQAAESGAQPSLFSPKTNSKLPADESTRQIIRGVLDGTLPLAFDPHIQLETTIFVRAGAGSGKTSVLVDRMLALVRSGISLEKIVAITFTKKAAGELQERFFERLIASRKELDANRLKSTRFEAGHSESEEALQKAWELERFYVGRAVENVEQVFVGTIHSFCTRLLRLQSINLGIPPDFEQIDDREEEKLRKKYWSSYLNRAAIEVDSDLAILQEAEVSFDALFHQFGTLSKHASADFRLSGSLQPDLKPTFDRLVEFVKEVSRHLPPGDPDDFVTEMERLQAMVAAFDGSDSFVQHRILKTASRMVSSSGKRSFKIMVTYWGANKTASRILANELITGSEDLGLGQSFLNFLVDDVKPSVTSFDHWLHDRALSFCKQSVEGYRLHRLQAGRLTFDDLLSEALRLVQTTATARELFQQMYARILVDEFQDTDPTQAAMLFSLASSQLDPTDWSNSTLIPGMLFLVGDDKQSIYRFRKADFQAFHLVGEAVKRQHGLDLKLTVNFRSDERICHWVNLSVGQLFGKSGFPYQAPWENLKPYHQSRGYSPIIHFNVAKSVGKSQYPSIMGESVAIVQHIRRMLDSDVKSELDYGSFLILVRRHTHIPTYVAALTQAGIPVGVTGGKPEKISEVLAWLDDFFRAVYNPNDGVSLIATLRGVFFGVSDQDLFDFVRNGGVLNVLLTSPIKSDTPHRLQLAVQKLIRFRELFIVLPPHQALEKVLAESGFEAMLRLRPDADLASGMLQRVLDLFRSWEVSGASFGKCVEDFGMYRDGTISLDTFSESVPYGSCVRIMTVHQAKGLQAPVVFLADAGGKEPPDSILHTHREGPDVLGLAPLVWKNGFQTSIELEPFGWAEALAEERLFDVAERQRLLYVACTRAELQLVISTNENPGSGPWDELTEFLTTDLVESVLVAPVSDLDEWFAEHPEVRPSTRKPNQSAPSDPATTQEESLKWDMATVKDQIEALSIATWSVKRPSDKAAPLAGISSRGVPVSNDNQRNKVSSSASRLGTDPSINLGMEYGSAIHALFESMISRRREKLPRAYIESWTIEVMQSRFSQLNLQTLLKESVSAALAFFDSPLWEEIASANRVLTEVPFTVTEVIDQHEWVVSGVVDLAYRNEIGWHIVDFKTDYADENILRERHSAQLLSYQRAWNQLFTDESCRLSIWSTHLGKEIEVVSLE
ncbi:MAG: UvrD-helicase domain-containing protein [Bacteroidetes bacterium]|nr:UvrD-helicase domain-containing protein [Bacteroidota bacterium]